MQIEVNPQQTWDSADPDDHVSLQATAETRLSAQGNMITVYQHQQDCILVRPLAYACQQRRMRQEYRTYMETSCTGLPKAQKQLDCLCCKTSRIRCKRKEDTGPYVTAEYAWQQQTQGESLLWTIQFCLLCLLALINVTRGGKTGEQIHLKLQTLHHEQCTRIGIPWSKKSKQVAKDIAGVVAITPVASKRISKILPCYSLQFNRPARVHLC